MSLQLICDYTSEVEQEIHHDYHDHDVEMFDNNTCENTDQIVSELINSHLNQIDKQFGNLYRFYRNHNTITSSDESESDSSIKSTPWSLSDSDDFDSDSDEVIRGKKLPLHLCTTKGEFTLKDLPPIETLQINVEVKELVQVGIVSSIIDQLIIIQSFKSIPVFDLDTVFFSKDGSSLGKEKKFYNKFL